ncbi:feruloyl-CoA synthase [Polymorphum gilvum]|uniref:AMP-dependent synthetase and ligase n=1 Tax=Polymorphum gilvum (strain LMG 25793 / CGMCC 1.9160 / SL003B-26A1) TaxID=991905 RepID=F2J6B9_POLGS|nr:feruloyl-CoA synthase [Polymorphum gilvum]ADZ71292.1 AMP-dependent synthetase and ligase [Polymorphum gilvum SL003B-26A1]
MAGAKLRAIRLWSPRLKWQERPDGSMVVWREDPLGAYPDKINERLAHWARVAPDRTWMAARAADGSWREVTYAQALDAVRRLGQAFLDRGLSIERPVMILSGNSIEHALVALGAQHVGIASAAISPAYALVSGDFNKLGDICRQITPGLVYAESGTPFQKAIDAVVPADVPVVSLRDPVAGREAIALDDLLKTEPTPSVDAAFDAVGPDTVAKFLFTSGTTGSPKAVIQTQRMMCANMEMVADCYAFLRDEPPVVVDWAPWNHTASGNKVFNLVIYHGGTFYIDEGKPTPKGIAETIRNLREVSPTWYFNVPAGFEMLVHAMESDETLRQSFFRRVKLLLYAGAGMAQHTWDDLNRLAEQTLGERILLATGLGSTETAPFSLFCTDEQEHPGNVGIPSQGITLKLVPVGDKLEARLKGPNITPGYWRNPALTEAAFDEEGFYKIGDALRFAVPGDPTKGFFFDGRIAENFKLQTGTWVAVGTLRAKLVNQLGGLARDAVIAGENQEELGALLLPVMPALRALVPGEADLDDDAVLAHPAVRAELEKRLSEHARQATGSATRVMRALFLDEEPSLDKGEITDKGSINQRAVLNHRKALVETLYSDDPRVLHAR